MLSSIFKIHKTSAQLQKKTRFLMNSSLKNWQISPLFQNQILRHFSKDPQYSSKETVESLANSPEMWLDQNKLAEYALFRVKKLEDSDFKTYYKNLYILSKFESTKDNNKDTFTILEDQQSSQLAVLYKIWLITIIPAVLLSLYLLYLMQVPVNTQTLSQFKEQLANNAQKSIEEEPQEDYSPQKIESLSDLQNIQTAIGCYHEFEDADLGIRLAIWMDLLSNLGVFNKGNEEEIRGVYHFLDQCRIKLGFDYIEVSNYFLPLFN